MKVAGGQVGRGGIIKLLSPILGRGGGRWTRPPTPPDNKCLVSYIVYLSFDSFSKKLKEGHISCQLR